MSHLILPLQIPTAPLGLYCVNQNGNRTTEGVGTEIYDPITIPPDVSNPASPWEIHVPGFGYSELSFGVGCGDFVAMSIETVGEPTDPGFPIYELAIDVHVNSNPVPQSTTNFSNTAPNGTIVINLVNVPCGNVVTLGFYIPVGGSGESFTTVTIISVT